MYSGALTIICVDEMNQTYNAPPSSRSGLRLEGEQASSMSASIGLISNLK